MEVSNESSVSVGMLDTSETVDCTPGEVTDQSIAQRLVCMHIVMINITKHKPS
jgi:hypothetical protein